MASWFIWVHLENGCYYSVRTCVCDAVLLLFLPRDAVRKRGLCRRAVSVCLSRSQIVSKLIDISSKFFHDRVDPSFSFFTPNGIAIFRQGPP